MSANPHPAHPRRDLRNRRRALRPIHARPDPLRWSESGRTPLISGGQGRTAREVALSVEVALVCAMAAGVALLVIAAGLVVEGALR